MLTVANQKLGTDSKDLPEFHADKRFFPYVLRITGKITDRIFQIVQKEQNIKRYEMHVDDCIFRTQGADNKNKEVEVVFKGVCLDAAATN